MTGNQVGNQVYFVQYIDNQVLEIINLIPSNQAGVANGIVSTPIYSK
jgi:hypothetical protein